MTMRRLRSRIHVWTWARRTSAAAFLALGMVAVAASSSFAADNAQDDYAPSVAHAAPFSYAGHHVARKKRQRLSRRNYDRFSGFGFRGDGFRTSGKYN